MSSNVKGPVGVFRPTLDEAHCKRWLLHISSASSQWRLVQKTLQFKDYWNHLQGPDLFPRLWAKVKLVYCVISSPLVMTLDCGAEDLNTTFQLLWEHLEHHRISLWVQGFWCTKFLKHGTFEPFCCVKTGQFWPRTQNKGSSINHGDHPVRWGWGAQGQRKQKLSPSPFSELFCEEPDLTCLHADQIIQTEILVWMENYD